MKTKTSAQKRRSYRGKKGLDTSTVLRLLSLGFLTEKNVLILAGCCDGFLPVLLSPITRPFNAGSADRFLDCRLTLHASPNFSPEKGPLSLPR
jgi:hypothetical protein